MTTTITATAAIKEPVYLMVFNAASQNRDKGGMMEVRLEGHQPTTATRHAVSLSDAIDGATTGERDLSGALWSD
ncbi:MAG: hypothetical protein PF961_20395 [Planctomycetota bacterium]|nr:hypothetical protein [Planctomycetota bacterium]